MRLKFIMCSVAASVLLFSLPSFAASNGESRHREHRSVAQRDVPAARSRHRDESAHQRGGRHHQTASRHERHGGRHHDRRHRHHDSAARHGGRHHRGGENHRRRGHRNSHAAVFLGGLALGVLGGEYHHHSGGHHEKHRRVSYWKNRYGECFRVEHRRHGNKYHEVPRYMCY